MSSNNSFEEIEATNGVWYKVNPRARVGSMVVPMNDQTLLSISVYNQMVSILIKDGEGIFQYAGDFSFSQIEKNNTFHMHATRLAEVSTEEFPFGGFVNEKNETIHMKFKIDPEKSSIDSLKSDN
ncbi:hypothetical protein M3664_04610 [Paenibacillus lautus]|uniref:hypothetical protein n=1 Tax=Paenibacillus lautus TaxID=1401 RepID=UPI0020415706|nr:hypothetical protein [Paenibacillus lautus]MCM3257063.1 hypothetical protein [Paenibacillus lautus]